MQYSSHSVVSHDGTSIGYRSMGQGPGVVLIQGAVGVGEHYDELARALATHLTVHVPDRRGRGLSPKAFTPEHSIAVEVQDIAALLAATGAQYLFGLSSGAIIALEAALQLATQVRKVAIYEPPFRPRGLPSNRVARFAQEIARGAHAEALVTADSIVQLGPAVLLTALKNRHSSAVSST